MRVQGLVIVSGWRVVLCLLRPMLPSNVVPMVVSSRAWGRCSTSSKKRVRDGPPWIIPSYLLQQKVPILFSQRPKVRFQVRPKGGYRYLILGLDTHKVQILVPVFDYRGRFGFAVIWRSYRVVMPMSIVWRLMRPRCSIWWWRWWWWRRFPWCRQGELFLFESLWWYRFDEHTRVPGSRDLAYFILLRGMFRGPFQWRWHASWCRSCVVEFLHLAQWMRRFTTSSRCKKKYQSTRIIPWHFGCIPNLTPWSDVSVSSLRLRRFNVSKAL